MEKNEILKPKDLAQRWQISVSTLQRWDRTGAFVAKRLPSGRRYYLLSDVIKFERSH